MVLSRKVRFLAEFRGSETSCQFRAVDGIRAVTEEPITEGRTMASRLKKLGIEIIKAIIP